MLAGNSLYKTVVVVGISILCEFVRLGILVVRPEITTWSLEFNTWLVEINPEIVPVEDLSKTTSL